MKSTNDRTFIVTDRFEATKYWSHWIDDHGKCHETETYDMEALTILVSESLGYPVTLRRNENILPYPTENVDPCGGFEFLVEVNRYGYLRETSSEL